MKTKHTPGPWIIAQTSDGTLDVCKSDGEIRSVIARLHVEHLADEHGGSMHANARLIAAAPALLAALGKIEARLDRWAPAMARGPLGADRDWQELFAEVRDAISKARATA